MKSLPYNRDMSELSPAISPTEFNRIAHQSALWLPLVSKIAQETKSDIWLTPFSEGSNIVFASGTDRVIKVFPRFLEFQYEAEKAALHLVQGRVPVSTPKLLYAGHHEGWPYLVMSRVEGASLSNEWLKSSKEQKCSILYELGVLVSAHHKIAIEETFPGPTWTNFIAAQISNCVATHSRLKLPAHLLDEIPDYLEKNMPGVPIHLDCPVLLTGEYTPGNVLTKWTSNSLRISSLIDYGDTMIGFHEYDFLGPCTFLAAGDRDLLTSFFSGYGYKQDEIGGDLASRLMTLLLLHRYSNLDVQISIPGWRKVKSLSELKALIWPLTG